MTTRNTLYQPLYQRWKRYWKRELEKVGKGLEKVFFDVCRGTWAFSQPPLKGGWKRSIARSGHIGGRFRVAS